MADEQPIIIIKKKGGHGGHHGGAWKVAYADFVTAMMSLFIVLWLMSSTPKPVQEEIAVTSTIPRALRRKRGRKASRFPRKLRKSKRSRSRRKRKRIWTS